MNKYSPMDVGNYPHDCLRNYVNEVKGHKMHINFYYVLWIWGEFFGMLRKRMYMLRTTKKSTF